MGDNVKIHDPTSNQKEKQPYRESDLEHLFRVRQWRNWDELVSWLREEGDNDNEFTPGEVKSMVDDFERLRSSGVEMPKDGHQLYEMARGRS